MALGNKVILGKETADTRQSEPVKENILGVRKVKPKFAPGMRFPCQD